MIQGNVNSQKYTRIFGGFLPYADALHPDDWVFQQDIAKVHTSEETSRWPANSPDLAPIGSLWALMKREIEKEGPKSKIDFEALIRRVSGQMSRKNQVQLMNSILQRFDD